MLGRRKRRPQSVYGLLDRVPVMMQLQLASGRFHTKKPCSRLLLTKVKFYWQKQQNRVYKSTKTLARQDYQPKYAPKAAIQSINLKNTNLQGI